MTINFRNWGYALGRLLNRKRSYEKLQQQIGYYFRDISLLNEAMSHRSFTRTSDSADSPSYERLEFLGDSILGMIVAEALFELYPGESEGKLTKLKAALVNEQSLWKAAAEINLGQHIRMSTDEANSGGRDRPSITSDCLEALIAAIYLDGGLDSAKKFVHANIMTRIEEVQSDSSIRNYKGELLEYTQGEAAGVPHYEVIDETGPDHAKVFTVTVWAFGKEMGRGRGHSKKEAEQAAAHQALRKAKQLKRTRDSKAD